MLQTQDKILLVEDEESHQLIILSALKKQYDINVVSNVNDALEELDKNNFSLIILDILLDRGTGYKICEYIKSQEQLKSVPIFFLTSKSDVQSKVKGFELGADDYITKPCNPLELRARIKAKLKKEEASKDVFYGGLKFDTETQEHGVGYKFEPMDKKVA